MLADIAGAIPPPPPPPTFHYYGPVRMCEPGASPFYAIDVLPEEAVAIQGSQISIQREGGGLGIGRIAGPGVSRMLPEAIEPLGEIRLPNAGILQRMRVEGRVRYRIDAENNRYWGWVEIGSSEFDGTDQDLAQLLRIKFGPEARAACANVPETLAATPERRDDLAMWLSPRRHSAPLTICFHYLALDLRAGETAQLPWHGSAMALVDRGGQQIAITTGLHPVGSPRAWPGTAGAIVDDPRFIASSWTPGIFTSHVLLPRPAAARVRVMTRADRERFGPSGGGHVIFSFASDTGEADRAAFARRLRSRVPSDQCYEAKRS